MLVDKKFVGILRKKYHLEIDGNLESYILVQYEGKRTDSPFEGPGGIEDFSF